MAKYCYHNLGCVAVCDKCRKRKQREVNPVRTHYVDMKANAKIRGLSFDLTLFQFALFCKKTNYINLKGRYGEDMTIDRKKIVYEDGTPRGYDRDNIQMITRRENNLKQSEDQKYKYSKMRLQDDPDCPF